MSLVPAELLLAASAVFTIIKIASEQQQQARQKPVPVRVEEEPLRSADEQCSE